MTPERRYPVGIRGVCFGFGRVMGHKITPNVLTLERLDGNVIHTRLVYLSSHAGYCFARCACVFHDFWRSS